jgi:hypothetical protein
LREDDAWALVEAAAKAAGVSARDVMARMGTDVFRRGSWAVAREAAKAAEAARLNPGAGPMDVNNVPVGSVQHLALPFGVRFGQVSQIHPRGFFHSMPEPASFSCHLCNRYCIDTPGVWAQF